MSDRKWLTPISEWPQVAAADKGRKKKRRRKAIGFIGALDDTLIVNIAEPMGTPLLSPRSIAFFAPGEPVQQGDLAFFGQRTKSGRPILNHADSGNLKRWREFVAACAAMHWKGEPTPHPVAVDLEFRFVRPPSVSYPYPSKQSVPDTDKLARAIGDALAGVVYVCDSQIVDISARKRWGSPPGVAVRIVEM